MKTLFTFLIFFALKLTLFGQVPVDAQHPFSEIHYSTTPVTNPYAHAWFQAVTLLNNHVPNTGYIKVDYIKLIEEDSATGVETVLHIENYNGSGPLTLNEGGLFIRFPSWYYTDSSNFMSNSSRSGGFLTINVGEQPDSINHFWGVRQLATIGKRHKVEIRVLISGDVALQAGMDYYTNLTTKLREDCKEAFYSSWFGDSNGEFVTVTFPNYSEQPVFDRSDYGFYQNGKFYLSKRLVDFCSGTIVEVCRADNGFIPELMTLNGDYYEYYTGQNHNSAKVYCFKLNNLDNAYVPHAVINNLLYPSDAIPNGFGGYNFFTTPNYITNIEPGESEANIEVFPNPAKDKLYFTNSKGVTGVKIYDALGKEVLSISEPGLTSIDISAFIPGAYFINITTLRGEINKKIIKTN